MKKVILFTHEPIVVPELVLGSREIGAVVEFQGLVREIEGELALDGLYYEAYEEMAEKVLAGHLDELGELHGCEAVEFVHRLGWVPVGGASLYIRVLSAHRAEGLRFLADSIDRLKMDVPIWKRVEG
ncbi:molybdopterin synthase catalytic subunit [Luteolibacter sp. AS25]|uniref:molybdopterin synthase catalytic subunit n=1 Tax=Luteolibacter sp. AS25 TaxID=3135776 RepID=UPI00398B1E44